MVKPSNCIFEWSHSKSRWSWKNAVTRFSHTTLQLSRSVKGSLTRQMYAFLNFYLFLSSFHFFLSCLLNFLISLPIFLNSRQNTINFCEMDKSLLPSWWVTSSTGRWCWWSIEKRHRAGRKIRSIQEIAHWLWQMQPPQIQHPPLSAIRSAFLHPSLEPHSLQSRKHCNNRSDHPFLDAI